MMPYKLYIKLDKFGIECNITLPDKEKIEKLYSFIDIFDFLDNTDQYTRDFLKFDIENYLNLYFQSTPKKPSKKDPLSSPHLIDLLFPKIEFGLGDNKFLEFNVEIDSDLNIHPIFVLFSLLHSSDLEGIFHFKDVTILRINNPESEKGDSFAKGIVKFGQHKKDIFILAKHLNLDTFDKNYELIIEELGVNCKCEAGVMIFDTLTLMNTQDRLTTLNSLKKKLDIRDESINVSNDFTKIKSFNTRVLTTYEFRRSVVGDYEILVDIGDTIERSTVLAISRDFDILETIDLKRDNSNLEYTKYLRVLQGELVVPETIIASIPDKKLRKENIVNQCAGIINLDKISDGLVQIISLKEDMELVSEIVGNVCKIDKSTIYIEVCSCRYIKLLFSKNQKEFDGEITVYRPNLDLKILRDKILWIEATTELTDFDLNLFALAKVRYLLFNQLNIANMLKLRNSSFEFGSINGFGNIELEKFKEKILNSKVVNISQDRLIIKDFDI